MALAALRRASGHEPFGVPEDTAEGAFGIGHQGEFSEQLGGYKLDTNPSFATLFDNANDAHRFSLLAGYALSQDSMMVLSGQKFDGAMDAGIIQIELPKIFTKARCISLSGGAGTWPKDQRTSTKDGIMHIVVPRKTALQVAMKVNKALGNKYPVHYAEGYYAFPQRRIMTMPVFKGHHPRSFLAQGRR